MLVVSASGHVLTRIVCKGAEALGILKDHDTELEVLEELLKQRRWRRGRRGKWYERRALILMTHMEKEQHVYRRAYEGIWEALADEDTHIGMQIYLLFCRRGASHISYSLSTKITTPSRNIGEEA